MVGDINTDGNSTANDAEKLLNELQQSGWEIVTTEVIQNPGKYQLVIVAKKRNYWPPEATRYSAKIECGACQTWGKIASEQPLWRLKRVI